MNSIPEPRGALSENRSLADLTWLRVGGPAEYFFQPADTDDLADFLRALQIGRAHVRTPVTSLSRMPSSA